MRAYFCNDSGTGKTLASSIFALLYAELNPNNIIYANYHLNIYNNITNKNVCQYVPYSLLPFSIIENGNAMIILDDFYAIKNSDFYSSILASMSRKLDLELLLTIQYYTDITKRVRNLCQKEIMPEITNIDDKGKLTHNSELILKFYNPKSLKLEKIESIPNVLNLLLNNIKTKNIYTKGNLYNTKEKVEFSIPSEVIEAIAKISNNFHDIEINAYIMYSKNNTTLKRVINEVCKKKGILNKISGKIPK